MGVVIRESSGAKSPLESLLLVDLTRRTEESGALGLSSMLDTHLRSR